MTDTTPAPAASEAAEGAEQQSAEAPQQQGAEQAPEAPKPAPPAKPERTFTQAEVDEVVGNRLARERAKYADYDDLKARVDAADAAKAEHEAALAKERERAEAAELAYRRLSVAVRHGLTDVEEIELMLTGTDEETLDRQAARLAGKPAPQQPPVGFTLDESQRRDAANDNGRDATARSLFGL